MGLILKKEILALKKIKLKLLIGGFIYSFIVSSFDLNAKGNIANKNYLDNFKNLTQKELFNKFSKRIFEKNYQDELLVNKNYLPSEIKYQNEISLKIDQLTQMIIDNNAEYKAALQRVDQAKARLIAAISLRSPTIDL